STGAREPQEALASWNLDDLDLGSGGRPFVSVEKALSRRPVKRSQQYLVRLVWSGRTICSHKAAEVCSSPRSRVRRCPSRWPAGRSARQARRRHKASSSKRPHPPSPAVEAHRFRSAERTAKEDAPGRIQKGGHRLQVRRIKGAAASWR